MSRNPQGYHDIEKIRSQVEAAHCKGTILRSEIESRAPGTLEKVTDYITDELTKRFGNGALKEKIQAIVIVAKK